MPVPLPVTFSISPLTPGLSYTPQQFADAIAARLSLDSQVNLSFFTSGSTPPTSNSGPWLKDGTTWYVWSDVSGNYIPQIIDFQSLRYVASETAPDQNIYTLWIKLDSAGKAQELRYFSGGDWRSVYDDSFLAIINQIAEAKQQYPFRGDSTADQNLTAAGDSAVVAFTESFDPANVFSGGTFTAPQTGYYQITGKVNMEVTSGTPTANTVIVYLQKNGIGIPNEFVTCPIPDDQLGQRSYSIATIIQLSQNDQMQVFVECSATGAGTWTIKQSGTYICGHRVLT